jgi:threonine dehydrogenase-like Zn-dependent dehydrogenase
MRALCWYGTNDVRYATVDDPRIENPSDVILKATASGICGSDLDTSARGNRGSMPRCEAERNGDRTKS